jgi:hypothetical protein
VGYSRDTATTPSNDGGLYNGMFFRAAPQFIFIFEKKYLTNCCFGSIFQKLKNKVYFSFFS